MCYGIVINGGGCPFEIRGGEFAGECGKKRGDVCPETLDDEGEEDDRE